MKWITRERPKIDRIACPWLIKNMIRSLKYCLYFIISIVLFLSCKDHKKQWLDRYAEIKCAYITDTTNLISEKKSVTKTLYLEKQQVEQNLLNASAEYDVGIKSLEEKIKKGNSDYFKKYREERDKHASVYGHISTPAYEKKIELLQENLNNKIANYNQQIEKIKSKREADTTYIKCSIELQKITTIIEEKIKSVEGKYKSSIDSLQQLLNEQNATFKKVTVNLQQDELKYFILQRDSLKESPCKK